MGTRAPSPGQTTRSGRAVAAIIGIPIAVAVVVVMLGVLAFARDPLGLNGGGQGHYPNVLEWTAPDPWANDDTFLGYERFTAEELNRTGAGRDFDERVRVVDATTPSRSNLVASVNAIDDYTWAATALASDGRCYAILTAHDPSRPAYGATFYAKFPRDVPCTAEHATRDTVRLKNPPS